MRERLQHLSPQRRQLPDLVRHADLRDPDTPIAQVREQTQEPIRHAWLCAAGRPPQAG
jgi:hypothetical protein